MSSRAVHVVEVEPGSVADRAGVRSGDRVVAVSGQPLFDSLDFDFAASEPELELEIVRDGAPLSIAVARAWGESLGLVVGHRPRSCKLACRFCFVEQQPKGLRRALCIKDDDLSLSFRDGNFVTLSSIDDEDLARACALQLSPLYVSVHATDPDVRADLLRPRGPAGRDVLPALRELVAADVTVHAQIVLVPGYNDGAVLERTLTDLAELVPGVRSIAVVPVGLTRFQADRSLRTWRPDEARALLAQVEPWRKRMKKQHKVPVVTPSDEWYLLAGVEPPPAKTYDGYPQMENGVGLVRSFLDDLAAAKGALPRGAGRRIVLATGRLAAPVIERAAARVAEATGADVSVAALSSGFWGSTVTVAGLLTGADLAAGLADVRADAILMPAVVLNDDGQFLDGRDLAWLQAQLAVPVVPVAPDVTGLREGVRGVLD